MTEERLPLQELLAKAGDGDFLRSVAEAVLQLLMEADVEGLIGAGRYERTGIGKSTVSKLCKEIDERVGAFLDRPLSGEWPYLWLDATYLRQREGGRIVSVAAIVAVAANAEGAARSSACTSGRRKRRRSGRPSSRASSGAGCAA